MGPSSPRWVLRPCRPARRGTTVGLPAQVGPPRPVEALRTVLPLRWHAAAGDAFFPTVDAQLEVAALSMYPPRVQLTLSGTYHPPFGTAGDVVDRVLAHRLAGNVVEDFVAEVAARLEKLVAETALTSRV